MAVRLIALRLPAARFGDALSRIWADGAAALPLPWDAPDQVIERTIRALRPAEIVTDRGVFATGPPADATSSAAEPLPADTALVVSTSGSSGAPKGVILTHAALAASTSASIDRLGAATGDRFTLALPLHHVAGIQILLRSRACGSDPEILDPALPVADALRTATGDHLSLVPTQLRRLLDTGVELRRWRTILLGGARATPDLLDRAGEAGARVVTSYGMTETCGGCVYDGYPLEGAEVARRDDGRIKLRGPMLFSGYLGEPSATSAAIDDDGWFVTGDLGTFAADGRLQVSGRADDLIVSGGENVPANAVADALRADPRILEVVVVGIPDEHWGEAVVAVVVPRDPATPPSLDELRALVRRELPASYAPRRSIVTDRIPRDAMGKVTLDGLRALLDHDGGPGPAQARGDDGRAG